MPKLVVASQVVRTSLQLQLPIAVAEGATLPPDVCAADRRVSWRSILGAAMPLEGSYSYGSIWHHRGTALTPREVTRPDLIPGLI